MSFFVPIPSLTPAGTLPPGLHRGDFDTKVPTRQALRALHRTHGFDIERVREGDDETLDYLLQVFFGHDRNNRPRGLIEVIL